MLDLSPYAVYSGDVSWFEFQESMQILAKIRILLKGLNNIKANYCQKSEGNFEYLL